MGILVKSFSTFGKCAVISQHGELEISSSGLQTFILIPNSFERNLLLVNYDLFFYASREVKQRQRRRQRERKKKAIGLDMQNNNFARKIHVFVAVTVVVAFKAP